MGYIRYRVDVLDALKRAGISSYRIYKDKLLPQSTLQRIREGNTSVNAADAERPPVSRPSHQQGAEERGTTESASPCHKRTTATARRYESASGAARMYAASHLPITRGTAPHHDRHTSRTRSAATSLCMPICAGHRQTPAPPITAGPLGQRRR